MNYYDYIQLIYFNVFIINIFSSYSLRQAIHYVFDNKFCKMLTKTLIYTFGYITHFSRYDITRYIIKAIV